MSVTDRSSDLDWFALETRLRCVVAELIEPLLFKSQEQTFVLAALEKRDSERTIQVGELEALVCKGTDRETFIDNLLAKVNDLTLNLELTEVKSRQQLEDVKKVMGTLFDENRELKLEQKRNELKIEKLYNDSDKLAKIIESYQETIQTDFSRFNENVDAATARCNESLHRAEFLADNASNLSINVRQQLPEIKAQLAELKKLNLELSKTISHLSSTKADKQQTQASMTELNTRNLKILETHTKSQKTLLEVLRFIENYLPLQIQMSIVSNLFTCLDRKRLKRLIKFDQKVVGAIHEKMLETKEPSLDDVITALIQASLAGEDRNTEFMIRLKSADSVGTKNSSSSIVNRGDLSKKNSKADVIEFNAVSRVSSVHYQKSDGNLIGDPQADIRNAYEESDLSEEFEAALKKSEVTDIKRLVQEAIIAKSDFVVHVEKQVDNFKDYVTRADDEVKLYVQVLQSQLEIFQEKATKDIESLKLTSRKEEDRREAWSIQVENLTQELGNLSQIITCLVEFALITQSLLAQDEDDKQNLKLTGLKSLPNTANPTLKLRPECLSCTGQSAMLTSAFKMACISYEPSSLNYRNKVFTRPQLLQLLGTLLQNSWQSASNKPPFDNFTPRAPASKPPSTASNSRRLRSRESVSRFRKTSASLDFSMHSSHFPNLKLGQYSELA